MDTVFMHYDEFALVYRNCGPLNDAFRRLCAHMMQMSDQGAEKFHAFLTRHLPSGQSFVTRTEKDSPAARHYAHRNCHLIDVPCYDNAGILQPTYLYVTQDESFKVLPADFTPVNGNVRTGSTLAVVWGDIAREISYGTATFDGETWWTIGSSGIRIATIAPDAYKLQ